MECVLCSNFCPCCNSSHQRNNHWLTVCPLFKNISEKYEQDLATIINYFCSDSNVNPNNNIQGIPNPNINSSTIYSNPINNYNNDSIIINPTNINSPNINSPNYCSFSYSSYNGNHNNSFFKFSQ